MSIWIDQENPFSHSFQSREVSFFTSAVHSFCSCFSRIQDKSFLSLWKAVSDLSICMVSNEICYVISLLNLVVYVVHDAFTATVLF